MKSLKKFLEGYEFKHNVSSEDELINSQKQDVKSAFKAFYTVDFKLNNEKMILGKDKIQLTIEFFKPGSCWKNKSQRNDGVYEKLAELYGEQPAFIYLHTIIIPKDVREKNKTEKNKDDIISGTTINKTLFKLSDTYAIPLIMHASGALEVGEGDDVEQQRREYTLKLVKYYEKLGFKQIGDWNIPDELDCMADGSVWVDWTDEAMWYLPKPLNLK